MSPPGWQAECERQRDVLPLPQGLIAGAGRGASGACEAVLRRRRRAEFDDEWAEEMVRSLNELYAGPRRSQESRGNPAGAQLECLGRLRSAAAAVGPPPAGLTAERALRELLARKGYEGEPATLCPVDVDRLSVPPAGHRPVSLATILGECGAVLIDRLKSKVVPMEEAREALAAKGLRRCYTDPGLRDPRRYAAVVRKLRDSGMIRFATRCRERVGVFGVRKKSGSVRLILDARRSNCWFGPPGEVRLATGASFGALEVDCNEPVVLGQVDVADAFFNFELLGSCRTCLPSLRWPPGWLTSTWSTGRRSPRTARCIRCLQRCRWDGLRRCGSARPSSRR